VKHHGILTLFKLALLGLLLCLPLASCTRVAAKASATSTEAMPVRAVPAISADVPLEIAAVGNVEAMDSVEVKSRVAGQINRVAFTEGQSVTGGQLLFSIDRDALERQALEEQANIERDAAFNSISSPESRSAPRPASSAGQPKRSACRRRSTSHFKAPPPSSRAR
jgi:membrane fusion protein, multidrug efflux system